MISEAKVVPWGVLRFAAEGRFGADCGMLVESGLNRRSLDLSEGELRFEESLTTWRM